MSLESGGLHRIDLRLSPENKAGVSLRRLSPENPEDMKVAQEWDRKTTYALNPSDNSHNAMNQEQLRKWVTDGDEHRLRMIQDPQGEIIGFVYLYNDALADGDFRERTNKIRRDLKLPKNRFIWEVNFCFDEGVNDNQVRGGLSLVLEEFSQTFDREKAIVMFVDTEDMFPSGEVSLKPEKVAEAEKSNQDTTVLLKLGFRNAGPISYFAGEEIDSIAYVGGLKSQRS